MDETREGIEYQKVSDSPTLLEQPCSRTYAVESLAGLCP